MKATGIIRKMDSLGRLVVPKEFRRTMGADDGTEFEIYTDGVDTICFKKVVLVENEIDWEKIGKIIECIIEEPYAIYDKTLMLQATNVWDEAPTMLDMMIDEFYVIQNGKAFFCCGSPNANMAVSVLSELV